MTTSNGGVENGEGSAPALIWYLVKDKQYGNPDKRRTLTKRSGKVSN
jgi:hypothetical protein